MLSTEITPTSQISPISLIGKYLPRCVSADCVYNPRVTHIGEQVRALRLQRRWSQRALAAQVGVDKQTIFRIEKTGKMRYSTAARLSAVLELPLSRFVGDAPPERTSSSEEADAQAALWRYPGIADHLGELLKALGRMSAKERADFINALLALLAALEPPRAVESDGSATGTRSNAG